MAATTEGATGAELTRFEEFALRVGKLTNEVPTMKVMQGRFLRWISFSWVRASLIRRTFVEGLQAVADLHPDRGVLLGSNHRSFFDQYAMLLSMYVGGASWAKRLYFPVRSNFFYEKPLGMLVNYAVGGGVMYPPVFRQAERSKQNKETLDKLVRFLAEPGTVVGVHPEGTRGKGPDPYEMLPAQPGIGQMALVGKPIVIPAFVNGLSNDIVKDIRANFKHGIRHERPCIIVFGEPLDYSEYLAQKPRPALYKKTADLFRARILELGERERELRRQCLAGEIADDHPGWLANQQKSSLFARIDD
ncbi:MAG: 1-acyl-sn-glycerol-3-phosphate acyltransferase [Myxococcales bacterium]|nr:1-acyl-sn-glycerol-3-phosphate acyltransferase [Myxococcales bacterium]